jgi:hypothetical protein
LLHEHGSVAGRRLDRRARRFHAFELWHGHGDIEPWLRCDRGRRIHQVGLFHELEVFIGGFKRGALEQGAREGDLVFEESPHQRRDLLVVE